MSFFSKAMVALGIAAAVGIGIVAAQAETYDDIMKAKKIKIAIDLTSPPYGMLDAQLKPTGSDVETAGLLANDWGIEIEYITTTGATRIPNLQTNKADIVISALSITDERKQVIDFSVPYAVSRSSLGAPKAMAIANLDDLKGKTVAVTRGTFQDTMLSAIANEKGFQVQRYDDDATMVTAAVTGQAQSVGTAETIIAEITKRNQTLVFEPKFVLRSTDIAIGLRKNEPQLKAKLDEWVATNIKNGKLNAIWLKYQGVQLPENFRP